MKGIEEKIIDGVKQYRAYFEVDGETHWQPSYGSLSKALNYRDVLERAFPPKSMLPKADIRIKDLTGRRFGRLKVLSKTAQRKNGHLVWHCRCDCGNEVEVVSSYLTSDETRSCGCLKVETDKNNLRDNYNPSSLFLGQEPRKDSSTGYRGVTRYYTRVSGQERYRAWVTVNGKRYYKSGFLTPESAYYEGRLALEAMYLPKKNKPPEN